MIVNDVGELGLVRSFHLDIGEIRGEKNTWTTSNNELLPPFVFLLVFLSTIRFVFTQVLEKLYWLLI